MHLALALALSLQVATPASTELLLNVGDPAPPFGMRDLDRAMFTLGDYAGPSATKPVKALVLAFFATWCEPCKKEIPIVKGIYQRWKAKGVSVVYVGLSQGQKDLEPFAKEVKLEWPVIPDAFGLLGRRYGASQLPHLFIIGADGRIAFQHRGIAPDLKQLIEDQLARVTGERPASGEGARDVVLARFERTLKLGRVPSSQTSAARWQPLAAFVGEAVSANVDVDTEASYDAFEKALEQGKYDLANAGPVVCHDVRELYEPLARIERQAAPTYQGLVFVRRDSAARTLADLAGKRVGMVSARSTSGGLYPELALIQAGLDIKKDVTIVWLGSHEKVAAAVKAGEVDAGACYEDCRDSAWPDERAKAAATRVLAYTPPIPGEMLVVKRALDKPTKDALRKAVLALNDASGILAQISQGELTVTAFVPATEKDLEAVHDAIVRVTGETHP